MRNFATEALEPTQLEDAAQLQDSRLKSSNRELKSYRLPTHEIYSPTKENMSIVLDQLTKRYEGHPVVNRLSLEIANGEFFVLIGPSGSGKSTVLRMIAGLNTVDEGRVILHGRDVTLATPQQRGVGFVFQHYALFQHMTVADNIEFGLRVRKVAAVQRQKRRDELLELVGLAGLGGRLPTQLSGGQQQRVALARALAHQPEVLLLDEPFGALDAKIRIDLRRALHRIQKELGITTIFVTHDQEEAFELADRLGVMNFGRLLEVGTPSDLYQHPQTEFVATFLGTANLMVGESQTHGVQVGPVSFPPHESGRTEPVSSPQRVQVLFRPEDVTLALPEEALDTPQLGQGEIEQSTFSGSVERLRVRLPAIPGVRPIAPPVAFGEDAVLIEATRTQDVARRFPLEPGNTVKVGVRRIHTLAHPGLSFLIITDNSDASQTAMTLGGQIARLAHARVTILSYGPENEAQQRHLQEVKEKLGSGLAQLEVRSTPGSPEAAVAREVERQPYDLVIVGSKAIAQSHRIQVAENILRLADHHLLLVPAEPTDLAHALVCVAGGEPGKEDVLFAGRFLRHLGAQATLLSVIPTLGDQGELHSRAQRFLVSGVKTLEVLKVPAQTVIRSGGVGDEITAQMKAGDHDLLVIGASLNQRKGEVSLKGVVGQIIEEMTTHPVLIVRSHYAATRNPLAGGERINIKEDIIP